MEICRTVDSRLFLQFIFGHSLVGCPPRAHRYLKAQLLHYDFQNTSSLETSSISIQVLNFQHEFYPAPYASLHTVQQINVYVV